MVENRCDDCAHNIVVEAMNCDYACAGVTEIEDDGLVVAACEDYEQMGDIERRLEAEQYRRLQELQDKLEAVLECEPADSGDEAEDRIWARANDLKALLDDFFDPRTGGCQRDGEDPIW